mgnify:CR=1 FL=1
MTLIQAIAAAALAGTVVAVGVLLWIQRRTRHQMNALMRRLDELERVTAAIRGDEDDHMPDQRGAVRLYDHANPRLLSTNGYAYLKVAEGCDNPCSFCHIPAMRGGFRSRPVDDLVAEAITGVALAGSPEYLAWINTQTRH